jgi:hypothetical protein
MRAKRRKNIMTDYILKLKEDLNHLVKGLNEDNMLENLQTIHYLTKHVHLLFKDDCVLKRLSADGQKAIINNDNNVKNDASMPVEKKTAEKPFDYLSQDFVIGQSLYGFAAFPPIGQVINIPELVGRSLGLEEGDTVQLHKKAYLHHELTFPYMIEIVATGGPVPKTRYETFRMGLVELSEDNKYYVATNAHQEPLCNKQVEIYWIPEKTVKTFDLKSGAIVDLRWNSDNPAEIRVLWRYREESVNLPTDSQKILAHAATKDLPEIFEMPCDSPIEEPDFGFLAGQIVLLVGMDMKEALFGEHVAKYGASLETYCNKHMKRSTLEPCVRRADIVVIAKSYVSHSNSQTAVMLAKRFNRPFDSFDGFGVATFLDSLKRAVNKKKATA